jgi:hypothetical protein
MSSNPESSLLRQPLAPLDPAVSSLLARSVLLDQLAPAQRAAAQGLQARAVAAWWTAGHPGWGILEVDTNAFLESKVGPEVLCTCGTLPALSAHVSLYPVST